MFYIKPKLLIDDVLFLGNIEPDFNNVLLAVSTSISELAALVSKLGALN